jgi:uncharacterized protein YkwD
VRTLSPALGWAALVSLSLAVAAFALPSVAERLATPSPAGAPPLTGIWVAYVAPARVCRGGDDPSSDRSAQRRTMSCLVNYARAARGLAPVVPAGDLGSSAAQKARQIVLCGFDHDPCHVGADLVFRRSGYGRGFAGVAYGENIALMSSASASPRVILNAWLNSPEHRENLFRADWTEEGVALLDEATVGGQEGVTVWVSHFGRRRTG